MWKKRAAGAVAALAIAAFTPAGAEADYPTRAVKVIVPLVGGAPPDAMFRVVADKLQAKWGQPVVVENRPGASHNIGADAVAKAEPDGYTLMFTPPAPLVTSRWMYKSLSFDPDAFVPVSVIFQSSPVVEVNPKVPASTLGELIAYAKANPGKLTYASPGVTTTPYLATEALLRRAGISMVHVAYQGLTAAQRDLIAGHIDVMLDPSAAGAFEAHAEGKLRVLAVAGKGRHPRMPDVPTVSETLPGYEMVDWFGMVAPPKTPAAMAEKLSQAIAEIVRMPDVAKRMGDMGYTPVGSTPADAAALIKTENDYWREVVAAVGMTSSK
jgi:tripartite-type tricarboxylate transporter receptor subunit TctC